MTGLIIFFLVSLSIISPCCSMLKDIYEGLNAAMSRRGHAEDYKQPTRQEVLMMIVGGILGILGAVLYCFVCAAILEDIILPSNTDSSIRYGISLVMTSLIFTGGFGVCDFVMEDEGKAKNISLVASVLILIIYLLLKVSGVLP